MLVRDIERHISHSLRGTGRFSAVEIVNAAGQELCNAHPWLWLVRLSTELDTVAGQSYVELPASRSILEIQAKGAGGFRSIMGPREILATRDTGTWAPAAGGFSVMLSYKQGADGLPQRIIEISPVPSESKTGALRVWYHGDWDRVTKDDDTIHIPSWLEPCFIEMTRAYAHAWQFPERGSVQELLASFYGSHTWYNAMATDGEMGAPVGSLSWIALDDVSILYGMSHRRNIVG